MVGFLKRKLAQRKAERELFESEKRKALVTERLLSSKRRRGEIIAKARKQAKFQAQSFTTKARIRAQQISSVSKRIGAAQQRSITVSKKKRRPLDLSF